MTSLTSAATIITFTSTSTFNLRVLAITSTDQLASHPSTFSTASTANNVTDSSIFLVNTTCPVIDLTNEESSSDDEEL